MQKFLPNIIILVYALNNWFFYLMMQFLVLKLYLSNLEQFSKRAEFHWIHASSLNVFVCDWYYSFHKYVWSN